MNKFCFRGVTIPATSAFSHAGRIYLSSMKTLSAFLLTAALSVAPGFAQSAGHQPNPAGRVQHRVEFLTTLLSLTPTQQEQATTIFTNAATADATVHSSLKTAHQGLGDAIKTNNTANIEQFATTIGNLTAQVVANQAKADAAFYQILTPEQQTKLSQFESQNHDHGEWGMRGPMHEGPPR